MAATISSSAFDSISIDSNRFNRDTRERFLKKRFAGLIQKSTKTLEKTTTTTTTATNNRCSKQPVADKMKQRRNQSHIETVNLRRKAQIQNRREDERRKLEQMYNPLHDCEDSQKVMRDFEKLIGYKKDSAETRHPSLTPYGSNTLLAKYAELTGLMGSASCFDKYRESLCLKKKTTSFVKRSEDYRRRKDDDAEEGEIIE